VKISENTNYSTYKALFPAYVSSSTTGFKYGPLSSTLKSFVPLKQFP